MNTTTKEKKSNSKQKQAPKPLVHVSPTIELEKRSIALSKTTWQILDGYLEFLAKYHNGKITSEQVLEARIKDLANDRAWKAFKKQSTNQY